MPITREGTAPYAPPTSVISVIERYRDRGLQTPFTAEVLERAGVSETLSNRTLQALKLLDLVQSDGKPTPEFEALARVGDAQFKERLGELISMAYGEVFQFADPAKDDAERVRDAFRPYSPRGQQERMVTLFMGLLEYTGLDVSAAKASRRPGPANVERSPVVRVLRSSRRSTKPPTGRSSQTQSGSSAGGGLPPAIAGLLAALPADGASWTTEARRRFLETFTAVLDFSVPLDDSSPEPSRAETEDQGGDDEDSNGRPQHGFTG